MSKIPWKICCQTYCWSPVPNHLGSAYKFVCLQGKEMKANIVFKRRYICSRILASQYEVYCGDEGKAPCILNLDIRLKD